MLNILCLSLCVPDHDCNYLWILFIVKADYTINNDSNFIDNFTHYLLYDLQILF